MKILLRSIFQAPLTAFRPISRAPRPSIFGQSNSHHQIRAFLISTPRALQAENLASRQKSTEKEKSQSDLSTPSTLPKEVGDSAKKHAGNVTQQSAPSVTALQESLEPLLRENGGKWVLADDGMSMGRVVQFKGFKDAWVGFFFYVF
ncbi:hypothetical protein ACHAPC_005282 [Botrytis cinerea]